jgi:putative ABC transport system permease protein
VALSYHFQLGIEWKLTVGLLRAIVQLLLLGFVLLSFLFSVQSLPLILLYLAAMLLIAATEVTNRQVRTYDGQFWDAVTACFVGGGICGIFTSAVVFAPSPWWNPRVFVPSAGMIIGNSVSGPAVSMDRLLSDITDKKHETEVRLALGATGFEAMLPTVRAAVLAAMMPNLNTLAIVGVVSIPGMMTGQLLGGSTPLVAAEYQMAILFMITATTTISTYLAVVLATHHAVLSPEQRLTPERIRKVTGPKQSVDMAVLYGLRDAVMRGFAVCQRRMCCCLAYCAVPRAPAQNAVTTTTYSALPQSSRDLELTQLTRSSESGTMLRGERDGLQLVNSSIHGAVDQSPYKARYELHVVSTDPAISGAPILELRDLNIKSGELPLFDAERFTFTLHAGQRVSLEGNSGVGKTRLLRAIAQLDDSLCGTCTLQTIEGHGAAGAVSSTLTLLGHRERTERSVRADAASYALWRSRVMYIPQVHDWIFEWKTAFTAVQRQCVIGLASCGAHSPYAEYSRMCGYASAVAHSSTQALPPLTGTPLDLLKEAVRYKSRSGTVTIPESKCIYHLRG